MNTSKKVENHNVEMSLENLAISADEAQVMQDDELKVITGGGGRSNGYNERECQICA